MGVRFFCSEANERGRRLGVTMGVDNVVRVVEGVGVSWGSGGWVEAGVVLGVLVKVVVVAVLGRLRLVG